jgi:hypothetical protein
LLLPYLDRPSGKPSEKRRRKPGSNERIGSSSNGNDSYMVSKLGRGYKISMGINRERISYAMQTTNLTIIKMSQKKVALM